MNGDNRVRINDLMDEIKQNERRLLNLFLSEKDHKRTCELLTELRAELDFLTKRAVA